MIISHSNKFIFFAVPKTATHSIRQALQAYCTSDDWQQQVLFKDKEQGPQALPLPEIAKLGHGHITVQQIETQLEASIWSEYLKFAFVRNPFDRFISVCFFLNRNNPEFASNALNWMKSAIMHERFRQRVLVRPQYQQLVAKDGLLAIDVVGKYEDLQGSFDTILAKLKLNKIALQVKNSSKHNHYRSHYDDELKSLVENLYKEDLRRFDYSF